MTTVSNEKLFAKVNGETLAQVPAQYSPSRKDWVGIAARTTVLAYNPKAVPDDTYALILQFFFRGMLAEDEAPSGVDVHPDYQAVS